MTSSCIPVSAPEGLIFGLPRNDTKYCNVMHTDLVSTLTHCGLVTPNGDTDMDQHWLRLPNVTITCNNVDLSSAKSSDNNVMGIPQDATTWHVPLCATLSAKYLINSSPPGQNGRHSGRRYFQMHFLQWKWFQFRFKFHWSLFLTAQLTIAQYWFR